MQQTQYISVVFCYSASSQSLHYAADIAMASFHCRVLASPLKTPFLSGRYWWRHLLVYARTSFYNLFVFGSCKARVTPPRFHCRTWLVRRREPARCHWWCAVAATWIQQCCREEANGMAIKKCWQVRRETSRETSSRSRTVICCNHDA